MRNKIISWELGIRYVYWTCFILKDQIEPTTYLRDQNQIINLKDKIKTNPTFRGPKLNDPIRKDKIVPLLTFLGPNSNHLRALLCRKQQILFHAILFFFFFLEKDAIQILNM